MQTTDPQLSTTQQTWSPLLPAPLQPTGSYWWRFVTPSGGNPMQRPRHQRTNGPGVKTRPAESGRGAMVDDAYQCAVFSKQEGCSLLTAGDAGVDRVMNARFHSLFRSYLHLTTVAGCQPTSGGQGSQAVMLSQACIVQATHCGVRISTST